MRRRGRAAALCGALVACCCWLVAGTRSGTLFGKQGGFQPALRPPQLDESALLDSSSSLALGSGGGYALHWQQQQQQQQQQQRSGGGAPPAAGAPAPGADGAAPAAARAPQRQPPAAGAPVPPPPPAPHKPLLPNVTGRDVALLLLTGVTLFIAAGGGIGGGAVFVVLNVFVGGFQPAQAVALSNLTILGGAAANFLANSGRRHPRLDRPLIDWDLIMVMEPTTMLGALLGSYANKLLPSWLTSCLLTALLVLLTWKLLQRGVSVFRSETAQQRQRRELEKLLLQRDGGGPDGSGLREPLLLAQATEDGGDTGHTGGTRRGGGGGGKGDQGAPRAAAAAAWFDAGAAADQSGNVAEAAAAPARPQHEDVLPVPAHLQPLQVPGPGSHQQQCGSARSVSSGSFALQHPGTPMSGGGASRSRAGSQAGAAAALLLLHRRSSSAASDGAAGDGRRATWRCGGCLNPRQLTLAAVRRYERQQLPWQPLLALLMLSAWVVVSDTSKALLPCGGAGYWLVVLSVVPPALLLSLLVRQWLLAKTAVKEAADVLGPGYEAPSPPPAAAAYGAAAHDAADGIRWTPRNSLVYPALCSAAGVVAGLFGVGGGIVKGPLMLELGVCPEVAAATTATMLAFTAGSAAVVYFNFGGVITDYASALFCTGFAFTLLGQVCTMRIVRLLGRRSVIIFAMGTLMVVATAAAGYQSTVLLGAAAAAAPAGLWEWGSICKQA